MRRKEERINRTFAVDFACGNIEFQILGLIEYSFRVVFFRFSLIVHFMVEMNEMKSTIFAYFSPHRQKSRMARLVSYRTKDENLYCSFGNEIDCNSSENLTERNRIRIFAKSGNKSKSKPKISEKSKKNVKALKSKYGKKQSTATDSSVSNMVNCASSSIGSRQCAQSTAAISKKNRPTTNVSASIESKRKCCCSSFGDCWRRLCCCGSLRCCCCRSNVSGYDDDDIDACFERYKIEMRLSELRQGNNDDQSSESCALDNAIRPEMKISSDRFDGSVRNCRAETLPSTAPTQSKQMHKKWNWNDSLRSNSDRFLETLEYEIDGDQSLKRNQQRHTIDARIKGYAVMFSSTSYSSHAIFQHLLPSFNKSVEQRRDHLMHERA